MTDARFIRVLLEDGSREYVALDRVGGFYKGDWGYFVRVDYTVRRRDPESGLIVETSHLRIDGPTFRFLQSLVKPRTDG